MDNLIKPNKRRLVGVIPAAGEGNRLFPYNGGKEVLPVGAQHITVNSKKEERPKIVSQYVIEAMAEAGIKHIIIVTRPTKHALMGLHLDGGQYGVYHYKSERSSQEGDWPLAAFSPRKQNLTLYAYPNHHPELLKGLGKHTTSVGCLYINKLADVNVKVLEKVIAASYKWAQKEFGKFS